MTLRDGLPYVFVTSVAKALCGDQTCLRQLWYKAHYKVPEVPGSFDLAKWKTEHNEFISAEADKIARRGYTVRVEDQNWIRVTGKTAILAGKPDIVATMKNHALVVDGKTGEPRTSDAIQVAIYLIMLPLCWRRDGLLWSGELRYKSGSSLVIEPGQVEEWKPRVFEMLRRLGGTAMLPALPSRECQLCGVFKADCPDRLETTEADVRTEEW